MQVMLRLGPVESDTDGITFGGPGLPQQAQHKIIHASIGYFSFPILFYSGLWECADRAH